MLDSASPNRDSPPALFTTKGSARFSELSLHLGGFGRVGTGTNVPSRVRVIGPLLFAVKSVPCFGCGGGGAEVDADLGGGSTRRFFVGGSSVGSKSSARALPCFGTTGLVGG